MSVAILAQAPARELGSKAPLQFRLTGVPRGGVLLFLAWCSHGSSFGGVGLQLWGRQVRGGDEAWGSGVECCRCGGGDLGSVETRISLIWVTRRPVAASGFLLDCVYGEFGRLGPLGLGSRLGHLLFGLCR
jgi:hypothetical protein